MPALRWGSGQRQEHLDGALGQTEVCERKSDQERPCCRQERSIEKTEQWKRLLSQHEGKVGGMERKQSFQDHGDAEEVLFVGMYKDVVG